MSDRRRPLISILLRSRGKSKGKLEIFAGPLFPYKQFRDLNGHPINLKDLERYYRIRISGVWFPKGHKVLYTADDLSKFLVQSMLKEK